MVILLASEKGFEFMPRKRSFDYEALARDYNNGIPMQDICSKYGCTNKSIHNAVILTGGEINRMDRITIFAVNKLLDTPKTVTQLAGSLSRSRRSIQAFLTKNDFPFEESQIDNRGTRFYTRKEL